MSPRNKAKNRKSSAKRSTAGDFPVVAIGASAGGLESVSQLLSTLSASCGMALVLIQHISPDRLSSLVPLLSRVTKLKVLEVTEGLVVRPNQVYVVPPAKDIVYSHPVLRLKSRVPSEVRHMPVDQFMESLARFKKSKAIGVVLSGTGSDGTRGLQKIREAGGLALVQSEDSAKFEGMPHSAISAGCADYILPPSRIAAKLEQLARRPSVSRAKPKVVPANSEAEAFRKILEHLRSTTGTDFSLYRQSTLVRRVRRRMQLSKSRDLRQYLGYLIQHEHEVRALRQDILINVTSFFRDPATFETFKKKVLKKLLTRAGTDSTLRIWVPGCASGEEVYSLAILLTELIELREDNTRFLIFGTDLSDETLKRAHAGVYLARELRRVSPGRLRRFFVRSGVYFQIRKNIRERCLFARHDLTTDTPFSRMDLISCRNVLIYLSTALQNRILPIFHYALNPGGFLLLGKTESVANQSELFSPVDRPHRIFKRRPVPNGATLPVQHSGLQFPIQKSTTKSSPLATAPTPFPKPEAVLLARRGPAAVLVNSELEILQFSGHLAPYLEPASGEASLSLLKMAHADLVWELRATVQRSKRTRRPSRSAGVRREGNGQLREVSFEVIPVIGPSSRETVYWIVFDPIVPTLDHRPVAGAKTDSVSRAARASQGRLISRLEHELVQTKAGLQEIIQHEQAANEELQAANEEILSRNEELQSINEEFETAKEELQSSNEELTTLNEELEHRHSELVVLHNDLTNLFGSLDIPIVILGRDHRIRRFSNATGQLFNLVPGDIGRSLGDLHFGALYADLRKQINAAIDVGKSSESQALGPHYRWLSIRVHPYRTTEGEIQGAILTLVDVHPVRQAYEQVEEQREFAEAILGAVDESLLVLDTNLRVIRANEAFFETFKVTPEDTINNFIYKLGNGQWNIPHLRKVLQEVLTRKLSHSDYEVDHIFPSIGRKKMLVNSRRLQHQNGDAPLVLVSIRDRTTVERALRMSSQLIQVQDEERRRVARELHDSTAQALAAIKMNVTRLEKLTPSASPDQAAVLAESRQLAESTIRELRTVSYLLHPPLLEEAGLASALRSFLDGFSKRSEIRVHMDFPNRLPRLSRELELALFRICQEAINNIHQHSESEVARVRLSTTSSKVILSVTDEGKGFRPGILSPDGNVIVSDGVGIPSMQERARQLGGSIEITSTSHGTTVRAIFPRSA